MLRMFFGLWLVTSLSAAAALLQCARCGAEYADGQAACARCGNALPVPATEAPPAAAPATRPVVLPADDIARSARELLDAGEPVRAWLRARHAHALRQATGAAPDPASLHLIRDAQTRARLGERECFSCAGTGQRTVAIASMDGKLVRQAAPGLACPVCAGRGRLVERMAGSTLETALIRARRAEDDHFRQQGWNNRLGVWLPAGMETQLNVRAEARLRTAWSRECETCLGAGALGCTSCDGVGRTACPNDDCVMGNTLCATCNGTRRATVTVNNLPTTRSCPDCRSTGIGKCTECEGLGYDACTRCESRGEQRCARCSGAGAPAACRRCNGEGLADCTRCRGSGTYRDAPCDACAGEGLTLCRACQGHGVSARR
ncbi:MAG TPA: hypothetical protein PKE12_11845 [Kiritimatiellia bacterium]|nr:hypothetical protein [Kiritimatiellia bacterium]